MRIEQDLQELQTIINELRKQNRLRSLHRILKIFLIGFFIGKGVEKKISALIARGYVVSFSLWFRDFLIFVTILSSDFDSPLESR
jgi:hypothetical protein